VDRREAGGVVSAPFGDDARATAYQPLHCAAASWAKLDLRIGHLLTLFKTASTGIALIIVCWHRESSFNQGGCCRYYTKDIGMINALDPHLRQLNPPLCSLLPARAALNGTVSLVPEISNPKSTAR
jgi:hypothetical protein